MLLWLILAQDLGEAVAWLERHPKPEGCVCLPAPEPETGLRAMALRRAPERPGPGAIDALALAEAYASTKEERWKEPLQKAIEALLKGEAPGFKDEGAEVFWRTRALIAARDAGLPVPDKAFDATRSWLEKGTERTYFHVSDPAERGRGVRAPTQRDLDRHLTLTAVGVVLRRLLGEAPETESLKGGVSLLVLDVPRGPDYLFWHAGSLALASAGPKANEWREKLGKSIRVHQRKDGCAAGSWDPDGRGMGRTAATALNVLTLRLR